MMSKTPHVSQRLLEMTMDELDAAREWMQIFGGKAALDKIASLLTILVRRDASLHARPARGKVAFDLALTREQTGDYLGLTLETVSRQISILKREGVIVLESKRRIEVTYFDMLLAETGDDTVGGMLN
jgi:CRP/FNR family transcriptional regulator